MGEGIWRGWCRRRSVISQLPSVLHLNCDTDFEDLAAFDGGTGSAENWLITFTTELRSLLPAGQYIISHAREYFHDCIYRFLELI